MIYIGIVDIHALTMSLKSGLKMEVTNALNILTVISSQNNSVALSYCEDLLDVLLDYLEQDIFGCSTRFASDQAEQITQPGENKLISDDTRGMTYAELFDMSLDEMKSLIPRLEDSTSELWLSLRERCLCIFNILRNFSFMPENIDFLAKQKRFVSTMSRILDCTQDAKTVDGKDTTGRLAWFVGIRRMDTLDFRKSVLIIFSNIAMSLTLSRSDVASTFIRLVHDFLAYGPDTYYSLLAIETWAKVAVNYENRKLFATLIDDGSMTLLENIWVELAVLIRRDFFLVDGKFMINLTAGQLAILEYAIMGLYNIVIILSDHCNDRQLKEQLFQRDRNVPMNMFRLCMILAESGVPHYSVAAKRGMELIRAFVCGLDRNLKRPGEKETEDGDMTQEDISIAAHRMLDMATVREALMMSMLRPTMDLEVLRELSDMVSLIDGEKDFNPV